MDFNEYQEAAMRTASASRTCLGSSRLLDILRGVMGLCGESGEMLEHMKKVIYQGHPYDPMKLAEELGDVLWYCAYLSFVLGFSMEHIAELNIAKLQQRYPDGFDVQRSVEREVNDGE